MRSPTTAERIIAVLCRMPDEFEARERAWCLLRCYRAQSLSLVQRCDDPAEVDDLLEAQRRALYSLLVELAGIAEPILGPWPEQVATVAEGGVQ